MAKKARAAAKRQKRLERNSNRRLGGDNDGEAVEADTDEPALSNAEIMAKVEELHRLYDDGQLDLDTFDEQRASLMSQISVV